MKAKIWHHAEWIKDTEPERLREKYDRLLRAAGFGIVRFLEHHFEPQGYTALWLLCESHFAVHTFPECGKSYIELSSCNREMYERFITEIDAE